MYRLKNMSTWKAWTTEEEAEPDGTSAQCPPLVPCPFYPDLPWPPQITALIPRPVAASTWLSNLPSPKLPDRPLNYLVIPTTMRRPTMARLMSMGPSRQYLHLLLRTPTPNDKGLVLFPPRPKKRYLSIFESFNKYRQKRNTWATLTMLSVLLRYTAIFNTPSPHLLTHTLV